MPIYEFKCLSCNALFEVLIMDSGDETEVRCPSCKETNFQRVMSAASHQVRSGRSGGAKVESHNCATGSCSTLTLPGPD
ncbi:MAG TPA: zinc ribbon domain-containing protein [Desulfobacteraceae bacterium]|nr:zinc ribbon domain-containing protein [Deltaproteobacteria bacterium]MBW2355905.1 zinc ribbon domain-containing protein [Deltaproteobacteria bacterium]RLB97985.1 MAG: zinc ribbon domain-containing protein [Deltaproteobacteria bacterium]HDI60657.1 zinc ribbon domain-containing protein [Desulfobacteraceae bacterium]